MLPGASATRQPRTNTDTVTTTSRRRQPYQRTPSLITPPASYLQTTDPRQSLTSKTPTDNPTVRFFLFHSTFFIFSKCRHPICTLFLFFLRTTYEPEFFSNELRHCLNNRHLSVPDKRNAYKTQRLQELLVFKPHDGYNHNFRQQQTPFAP